MSVSRRRFLTSVSAAAICPHLGLAAPGAANGPLPWTGEPSLREAAKNTFVEGRIDPTSPVPDVYGSYVRPGQVRTTALTNPAIKSGIWGPSHRITLSMIKTDVHDRRVKWPKVVTLDEVIKGAEAPVNRDAIPDIRNTTRAAPGYLKPTGGRAEPYAEAWHAYAFPCQKPVGQIILMVDELEGAAAPATRQSCSTGTVTFAIENGPKRAGVDIVLSMTRNLYAIRIKPEGLKGAAGLRLYRHRDQAHLQYMMPDGRYRTPASVIPGEPPPFRYEDDAAWNGPIDPPRSGTDGKYFWITQTMPAEKTFPDGFHYVMMGLVAQPAPSRIVTADGRAGLGTKPYGQSNKSQFTQYSESDLQVREAPGSAATAQFDPTVPAVTAYVVVVTQLDAADYMAEARRRLDQAARDGFEGVEAENRRWYDALYERREDGRVFYANAGGAEASEDVRAVFASWYCRHSGGCKTDMRRLQASASYARLESDWQPWHGLPCYNDGIWDYTIPAYVRSRGDAVDMWKQLAEHWWQACRANAREMYGMPGMALMHGYLPPIKPDRYVHTNLGLELGLATMGQVLQTIWNEWDYGGDRSVLDQYYPILRDMARFYAGYARTASDGRYHLSPTVEQERWGIFPGFTHSKDTTGSLCMARWALLSTAEAAELLDVDEKERRRWRTIAARLVPYPTWDKPAGRIFAGASGVEPFWFKGDHEYYEGVFPATITGEVNLDSTPEMKAMMALTAKSVTDETNDEALVLIGACPDTVASVFPPKAPPKPIVDWKSLRDEVTRYPERLLNSRSGRIHLFPCVPAWATIGFRRFQARGGFLVSAARDPSGVHHVEIESRRDIACTIANPWPGRQPEVIDRSTAKPVAHDYQADNDSIRFAARAGAVYELTHG